MLANFHKIISYVTCLATKAVDDTVACRLSEGVLYYDGFSGRNPGNHPLCDVWFVHIDEAAYHIILQNFDSTPHRQCDVMSDNFPSDSGWEK